MLPGIKIVQYGDVRKPVEDRAVIVHIVNDWGRWGAGFTGALTEFWPEVEQQYRAWHNGSVEDREPFALGNVQLVNVSSDDDIVNDRIRLVANMVAQRGIRQKGDPPWMVYVSYADLYTALHKVYSFCSVGEFTVHMPRIGCGYGGGRWEEVEKIIAQCLDDMYVRTYVYDPPPKRLERPPMVQKEDVGW